MTYIIDKQQKCLREKAPDKPVFLGWNDYAGMYDYNEKMHDYNQHIASIKSYSILPEQWALFEDGSEVEEGEFELEEMWSMRNANKTFAVPKQKQVSQSQEQLWEDVLKIIGAYTPVFEPEIKKLQSKYIILPRPQFELLLQETTALNQQIAEYKENEKRVKALGDHNPSKIDDV